MLRSYNDQAVLDKETRLVWEQSPSTTSQMWLDTQRSCNRKTVGNRKGWRLPTTQELASLVDPTQSNPALPPGHPFSNVQSALASSTYWSATIAFPPTNSFAWTVSFVGLPSGFVGTSAFQGQSFFSWCVRGGQGANPQ